MPKQTDEDSSDTSWIPFNKAPLRRVEDVHAQMIVGTTYFYEVYEDGSVRKYEFKTFPMFNKGIWSVLVKDDYLTFLANFLALQKVEILVGF